MTDQFENGANCHESTEILRNIDHNQRVPNFQDLMDNIKLLPVK